MMLAIVIRMLSPNVITRIPEVKDQWIVKTKGFSKIQPGKSGTFAVISPIKPPKTIPESRRRSSAQELLLFILFHSSRSLELRMIVSPGGCLFRLCRKF